MKKVVFSLFLIVAILSAGCKNEAFEKSSGTAKQAISSAKRVLSSAKKNVPASALKDFENSLTKLEARLKKAKTVDDLRSINRDASGLQKSIEQIETRWTKAKGDADSGIAQAEVAINAAVAGSDLAPANTTLTQARTKLSVATDLEELKTALGLANQAKDLADKASAAKKAADEAAATAKAEEEKRRNTWFIIFSKKADLDADGSSETVVVVSKGTPEPGELSEKSLQVREGGKTIWQTELVGGIEAYELEQARAQGKRSVARFRTLPGIGSGGLSVEPGDGPYPRIAVTFTPSSGDYGFFQYNGRTYEMIFGGD